MMFLVYDIGHVWSLKIMKDENSYTHQTLGFVWEAIKVMIISNFWFKVNQIQHYTKGFFRVVNGIGVEKCGFDMGCEFAKGQVLL